jgi:hypothetical protein
MARKKKVQEEAALEEAEIRYPDLLPAIDLLKVRLQEDNDEHEVILKWLELLQKVEQEMRHLERIENLSGAFMRASSSENQNQEKN